MTAPNYLLKMHDVARSIKNQHNIDIMVPNGVKIGNKVYPAFDKDLSTDSKLPDVSFKIPLENGHVIHMSVFPDGKSFDGLRDIPGTVGSSVLFPDEGGGHDFIDALQEKTMYESSKEQRFWVPSQGTTDDLVLKISDWAKQPGTGIRRKTPTQWLHNRYYSTTAKEIVPAEELASHYQKHKENKKKLPPERHPNFIRVSNVEGANRFWDYNISTEEFKSTKEGE